MNKNNKKLVIPYIMIILLFVWAAVIFSFSLRSGAASHSESGYIITLTKRINLNIDKRFFKIYAPFVRDKNHITLEEFVRKSAHFTEYFIFGIICGTAALYFRRQYKLWYLTLLCGVPVSFIDERLIQRCLVTGRTSSYKDVLLDCIGFYFAIAFALLFAAILKYIKVECKD